MSSHIHPDDVLAQILLLAEEYSSGKSVLELREEFGLSERQFAQLFLRAQQEGLLRFDPDHVRGARFGSTLKKEIVALLGIAKGEEPILLLKKTPEGVLVTIRPSSPIYHQGALKCLIPLLPSSWRAHPG